MGVGTQLVSLLLTLAPVLAVSAQGGAQAPAKAAQNAISVRSNLVIVPAFVKTKHGDVVFSLTAKDFIVTDDGLPQRVQLEPEANSQPLALVIVAQTGGQGSIHLEDYRGLDAVLDAIIGAVPHRLSVVSFDSTAKLEQGFDGDTERAAKALAALSPGDQGVAILDGLRFATLQLAKQPGQYRRAVLLLSETIDSGSQTSLDETLRAIDDTNTAIYSFAFSSTKAALRREGAKLPLPRPFPRTKYSSTPYKAGGCMSREPGADPDAHGSRGMQAVDCAGDLLPPLRIARMAYIAASDGFQKNVPETVAQLTGGEYFSFKNAKTLQQELFAISNDVHNQYILSFQPNEPHAGLHALTVTLKDRNDLVLKSRNAYWIDEPPQP